MHTCPLNLVILLVCYLLCVKMEIHAFVMQDYATDRLFCPKTLRDLFIKVERLLFICDIR